MRRQEVGQQPLQACFAELAAQMRQFEQIVQVVDRVAQSPNFAELFFRGFQMLLNFFKLGEPFFNILVEFLLYLLGDRHQLRIHAIANRFQALRSLLIQALNFVLQLLRGEQQRTGQFAAAIAEAAILLFPARRELLLDRAANL